jgi:hypothetical protein
MDTGIKEYLVGNFGYKMSKSENIVYKLIQVGNEQRYHFVNCEKKQEYMDRKTNDENTPFVRMPFEEVGKVNDMGKDGICLDVFLKNSGIRKVTLVDLIERGDTIK